jgi:hypothetical protein
MKPDQAGVIDRPEPPPEFALLKTVNEIIFQQTVDIQSTWYVVNAPNLESAIAAARCYEPPFSVLMEASGDMAENEVDLTIPVNAAIILWHSGEEV